MGFKQIAFECKFSPLFVRIKTENMRYFDYKKIAIKAKFNRLFCCHYQYGLSGMDRYIKSL